MGPRLQQEMERLKSNGTLSLPVILGVEPYWVALSKHRHWATVVGGLGTPKRSLRVTMEPRVR